MVFHVEANCSEGHFAQFTNRVGLTSCNDVIIWRVGLHHAPHGIDIVGCVTPVALSFQVAKRQGFLESSLDPSHRVSDLAGDKFESTAWRLVVEQNAGRSVEVVTFAVVDRNPVAINLGHAVRASWVERRGFFLWDFDHFAEHL